MPRFFIDTSDERAFVTDDVGLEFDNVQAARDAVVAALPEMARDALPSGDHHTFFATVRDQHDRVLLKASLTLSVVLVDLRLQV